MDAIQRKAEFTAGLKVVKSTIAMNRDEKKSLKYEIAVAFHDAYKADGGKKYKTFKQIAIIADEAAENFLTTWCK